MVIVQKTGGGGKNTIVVSTTLKQKAFKLEMEIATRKQGWDERQVLTRK
jgi:hypothetical protein